jgi:gas vesicle protein
MKSVILAFLGGALLGAGATALLTPKTGREMRKDLKRVATTTGDKVGRVPRALRGAYNQASEVARDTFSEVYRNGR